MKLTKDKMFIMLENSITRIANEIEVLVNLRDKLWGTMTQKQKYKAQQRINWEEIEVWWRRQNEPKEKI